MMTRRGLVVHFYYLISVLAAVAPDTIKVVDAFAGTTSVVGAKRILCNSRLYAKTSSPSSATTDNVAAAIVSALEGEDGEDDTRVPITLLSGFLGSGKTCTLQHLLETTEDVRIGVIVNDVASVNIDSKLISGKTNDGILELQNGCACCSLADELLTSVDTLLSTKKSHGHSSGEGNFDALVVELSGVADPMAIKSNWKNARSQDHPATKKSYVSKVVTLVDATTFGTDWMTWDSVGDREGWIEGNGGEDSVAQRLVPELLAEQIEAANVVLVNKIDLAGENQTQIASSLAKSVNEEAKIVKVEYGRVTPNIIVQKKKKEKIELARKFDPRCDNPDCSSKKEALQKMEDEDVVGEEHIPGGDDIDEMSMAALKSLMSDMQGESEDNLIPEGSTLEEVRDIVWDRVMIAHEEHAASHASTSVDQLGITNFVYKSNRPFNTNKLFSLLNQWPVPIKDDLSDLSLLKPHDGQEEEGSDYREAERKVSPFAGVLRSKGFSWFAPNIWQGPDADDWKHDTAMYWSHAGKHFEIVAAGKWWGTITSQKMKSHHFSKDMDEYERITSENFISEEFGDRRQEIVFIGVNIDEKEITNALDSCLVSDMDRYREDLEHCTKSSTS